MGNTYLVEVHIDCGGVTGLGIVTHFMNLANLEMPNVKKSSMTWAKLVQRKAYS